MNAAKFKAACHLLLADAQRMRQHFAEARAAAAEPDPPGGHNESDVHVLVTLTDQVLAEMRDISMNPFQE